MGDYISDERFDYLAWFEKIKEMTDEEIGNYIEEYERQQITKE